VRDWKLFLAERPGLRLFLFLFVFFATLTKNFPGSASDTSRILLIEAVIERHEFAIDDRQWTTIDKYRYEGRFYSDKPPLLLLCAAPLYFVLNCVGLTFKTTKWAYFLMTSICVGAVTALALVVFRRIILETFRVSPEWADLTALITGLGTLLLPYSVVFNNHAVAGALILFGFRPLLLNAPCGTRDAAWSGLLFSLAGGIDISCFMFLPLAGLLFLRDSAKTGIVFALAAVPLTALYFLLNLWTSGSLRPPAMNPPLWDYPGSQFGTETLSGLAKHPGFADVALYAFHMLIGRRGLLPHVPVLLGSLIALPCLLGKGSSVERPRNLPGVFLGCAAFMAMYIFRSTNYGGWSFGPRWYATLMPLLCLPLASLEPVLGNSRKWRMAFLGLVVLSLLISAIGAVSPWTPEDVVKHEPGYPSNSILCALNVLRSSRGLVRFRFMGGMAEALCLLGWAWWKWRRLESAAGAPGPIQVQKV
jgi:hypothetical protein